MAEPMPPQDRLTTEVGRKAARRLRARRERYKAQWFTMGPHGMVGWSIVVPTLAGVAFGAWIDTAWPGRFSWTLMLMVAGLGVGCWNAWRWVALEQRAIRHESDGAPEEPRDE
jgi:ATP synthase protein I